MKLRNKKTKDICEAKAREDGIYIKANWTDREEWFLYDLETLASGWDYYVEPAEPKRYRLLKDLPTFDAGDEFYIAHTGALWYDGGGDDYEDDVCAYSTQTLMKFSNILTDWFEPIDGEDTNVLSKEPLIKDEKIRKAVRAWAKACDVEKCNYDGYGDFATKWHGIKLDCSGEQLEEGNYTITELCGDEE